MRALSVKQPWAELIARGKKKKKEFRTWSRSCFGELLIVASKAVQADDIAHAGLDAASLVFGRAVCVVDFYKVTGDEDDYAWHLRNPRRVEPIEVRGSASLYHVLDARIRIVGGAKRVEPKSPRKAVRVPPRRGSRRSPLPVPNVLEPEKLRTPPKCPACGAGKAIPIVYGMPGPELWEEEKRGAVEIGGCAITVGYDPAWRCRKCGEAFGLYEHDLEPTPTQTAAPSKRKTVLVSASEHSAGVSGTQSDGDVAIGRMEVIALTRRGAPSRSKGSGGALARSRGECGRA